ncbi:cytochrome P450 76A2-like [Olea europaea subsp. europaea]|uniref:Cytochrome P450 76A2-like n=1 Tax=Olea europaea subsp. europaea TaxID=158383 RepID=A0A8S0RWY0_OLEEU|nr:cytochrome P450 76A2-like [Olea europaea subsp. europaea]
MDRDMGKALKIAATFVKGRIEERKAGGEKREDFLDVLLEFEGSNNELAKLSELEINIFILAIGREEECWEEPLCFKPERFLGSKIEYKGQHFEFIPFGAGRRICPDLPLGHRMMHFALCSLLHEFDWEHDFSTNPNPIDTNDKIGLVERKLEPLKVIPRKYVV